MKSKAGKRLAFLFWLLVAAACVALYIYIYVIPGITGALTKTAVLNYAEKQVSVDVRAVIVRTETLVRSETAGSVSYYVSENEKVRRYTKVADVYPSGGSAQPYTLTTTGVVSYYIDGLEEKLTPETIESIVPLDYLYSETQPAYSRSSNVGSGGILCKVITSDTWYIVMIMTPVQAITFEEGAAADIYFGDYPIKATIDAVYDKGDYVLVSAATKRYYAPFARIRLADVTAASKTYKGLTVPLSALTEQDGQTGVMVKQINGDYEFVPVNILLQDEEEALVSQSTYTVKAEDGTSETVKTVSLYDEVLRDAQ